MLHNGTKYERRRGETRHYPFKVGDEVPVTGLVNGAVTLNGCPAASTRESKSTPVCTRDDVKPQCMVNGYIDHGDKGQRTKGTPRGTLGKHESTISAAPDASAAVRVRSARPSGGPSVNGTPSLDSVAPLCNSQQMAPQPNPSSTAKKRRWRKFREKKRNIHPPALPPQEEEDWESQIKEVTLTGWDNMCSGFMPYGPEDVIHYDLRNLTIKQTDPVDLPVTAKYSPAELHRQPVKWWSLEVPTEAGQFADADADADAE
ncbi:uncharacterized protein [Notothenia coriiceps]|uniref:Uncharacterized protein n=1 Tax=Notothenia coriiceps TaxID=8208 RepID=A0A6I9NAP9_9TELE|nr:PREDICTED: uncharacterized protein LOC104947973 [Notothenia coriiceps]